MIQPDLPGQLDAQGYAGKYDVYDPKDAKIPASFAVFTTSKKFADAHPTAVADFLRRTSFVRYDRRSLAKAAGVVAAFAGMESLDAHGRSLQVRLARRR